MSGHPADPRTTARDFDSIIGQNLRTVRLEKGLSQEQIAKDLGLTFQQIQKYENGSNRISGGRLCQIAQICGVSIARLFAGVPDLGTELPPDFPSLAAAAAQHRELLDAVMELPQPVQTQIKHLAATTAAVMMPRDPTLAS